MVSEQGPTRLCSGCVKENFISEFQLLGDLSLPCASPEAAAPTGAWLSKSGMTAWSRAQLRGGLHGFEQHHRSWTGNRRVVDSAGKGLPQEIIDMSQLLPAPAELFLLSSLSGDSHPAVACQLWENKEGKALGLLCAALQHIPQETAATGGQCQGWGMARGKVSNPLFSRNGIGNRLIV